MLSGPDLAELKTVRLALKKCLKTARLLLLEREYLRFIRPDPTTFIIVDSTMQHALQEKHDPELAFPVAEEKSQSKAQIQETLALTWDRRLDPEFKQLDSPFLYEKEMTRDFLVFEYFSLVVPSQKDWIEDLNLTMIGSDVNESMVDIKRQESIKRQNDVSTEEDFNDEASIRRKIKQMCTKPQKQLVRFYNEESDISLYQMIKRLAT